jgi:RecA-family ATPase
MHKHQLLICKGIAIMSYEKSKLNKVIQCSIGSAGYNVIPEWTVQHYIPSESVGYVYAPPDSYKTFLMMDIAACVATGEKWAGKTTQKGNVLYISAEGGNEIAKRAKGWEVNSEIETESNILIIKEPLSPVIKEEFNWLLNKAIEHEELTGFKTKLIVFDTLSQCAKNLDDNSSKDMSEFIRCCIKLSIQLKTAVIFVHHTNKSGQCRGSSVFEGNTDFIFEMKKAKENLAVTLYCKKQKDYKKAPPLYVKLASQDLDLFYSDGEAVSSLVVSQKSFLAGDNQIKAKPKKSQKELSAQKLHDRAIAKIPAVILAIDDLVDDSDFDSRMQKKRALEVLSKYPNITLSADYSNVTVTPPYL